MYFYNESLIFSLHSLHKYNKLYLRTNKKVSIMQAMFKSELAKLAGVSSRTFRRYLATRRAILTAMGVSPFARKLPPSSRPLHLRGLLHRPSTVRYHKKFHKKNLFSGASGLKGTRHFPNVVTLQMKSGRRSHGTYDSSESSEQVIETIRTSD